MFLQYVFKEEQVFANSIVQDVIFTGVIEEFFKWLILILIIYHHVEFDDPYDGVLYGVAVSLGFASVENVFYLLTYGMDTAFLRALLPVSSHALFGVVMGFYIGKAKFNTQNHHQLLKIIALIIPMLLHIAYNMIFVAQNIWMYLMIPFMLFLWWFSLKKVKLAHLALIAHLKVKAFH